MAEKMDELKIAAAILCNKENKSKEEIAKDYWEIYDALRERLRMPGVSSG